MATDKQLEELGISKRNIKRSRSPEATRVMKEVERCMKLCQTIPKRKPKRK